MAKGELQASTDPQKPDQPRPLSYLAGFCNKIDPKRRSLANFIASRSWSR
jgi:hypothetical protein